MVLPIIKKNFARLKFVQEYCGKFQLASENQIRKIRNTSTWQKINTKPPKGRTVEGTCG